MQNSEVQPPWLLAPVQRPTHGVYVITTTNDMRRGGSCSGVARPPRVSGWSASACYFLHQERREKSLGSVWLGASVAQRATRKLPGAEHGKILRVNCQGNLSRHGSVRSRFKSLSVFMCDVQRLVYNMSIMASVVL